ncbi:exonuclease V, chloroplastic-like [Tasmannia lanceolata]|uniref:exonuclease V, chloroplastic-like n=1 Tax=Tasmannia lanceolata TaxID=3420 RepID=UPI004063F3BD
MEETHSKSKSSNEETHFIPIEIVSEEEMGFIEAALSSVTRSSISSFPLQKGVKTLESTILLRSQRTLASCSIGRRSSDIEDSGGSHGKKLQVTESLLNRFRNKRGLSVTDVTTSEWCERQMEFILLHGKPKRTNAMKAGSTRHAELEEEVIKRVEISIQSVEESWAIKLMNFVVGTNQLLFEGLTREVPVIGLVEGVWMTGVIDEIRIPMKEAVRNPSLIDTKTRSKATLPSEAQKRNARLQLMCYKYLWDGMVADNFPSSNFFEFFRLNPQYVLSEDVKKYIASSGFHAETFGEMVTYFRNVCCLLPPAHEQLLLRYEFQGDHSLLDEYQFPYDVNWVKSHIQWCLKFWKGEREASYVSEDEQWKCRFCSFAAMCPMTDDKHVN